MAKSKKAKIQTVPSIPEMYRTLKQDPTVTKNCIVEDVHFQFFRFNHPSENHIVKDAVQNIWPTFDKFAETPKAQLLTYHAQLFKSEPPETQDLTITALMVWYKLAEIATNRTFKAPTDPISGKKSTTSASTYKLGSIVTPELGLIKTPQALACYKIFKETLAARDFITEAELKVAVIARAGELRTRQDPWRIFQYYRPTLIKLLVLRREG